MTNATIRFIALCLALFVASHLLPKANASVRYPRPYKKTDPRKAGDIACENWVKKFCCYTTAVMDSRSADN